MNNLLRYAILCAVITLSALFTLWYFAGFEWVILLSSVIYIGWLLPEVILKKE